jgi:uncharacterized protein YqeY
MSLKTQITEDMKAALRAGEKDRLGTIRMLLSAIKQREVDERRDMADTDVLQIVEKLIKQRREASVQFAAGARPDLEKKELAEAEQLAAYLPAQLGEAEITTLVRAAIAQCGASSAKDMGKVMNALRPQLQGRADMARVSAIVKSQLTA